MPRAAGAWFCQRNPRGQAVFERDGKVGGPLGRLAAGDGFSAADDIFVSCPPVPWQPRARLV